MGTPVSQVKESLATLGPAEWVPAHGISAHC